MSNKMPNAFRVPLQPPPPYPGCPVTSASITLPHPPVDTVTAMSFSPAEATQNLLVAGSWDKTVRCWEIKPSGRGVSKASQSITMPILDVCWNSQGHQVFIGSCNNQVQCWDLVSNRTIPVASHNASVQTCNWISTPKYTCLMTGSWDKTLKFWDLRIPNAILTINLKEKVYCADVDYPVAVVGTGSKGLFLYTLDGQPELVKVIKSPLNFQHRCLSVFRDTKTHIPAGFGVGSDEGFAAIEYFVPTPTKRNFSFKCHRRQTEVNDMKTHPIHGTLVTVGSDSVFTYWDLDARAKLRISEEHDQAITKCCFNLDGQIFAYSVGYNWSKGHEYYNPSQKPRIILKPCFEDTKRKTL